MSSLQVDSISSMGGGHVDGAGKVVQFKEAVNTTETTIASSTKTTIATLNFTPKFSDSLILVQGFHSNDSCGSATTTNYCNCKIYAGTTEGVNSGRVGYGITKEVDARFQYGYTGTIASWGTTSLAIDLDVQAFSGNWNVSIGSRKTSLLVWEIAQ